MTEPLATMDGIRARFDRPIKVPLVRVLDSQYIQGTKVVCDLVQYRRPDGDPVIRWEVRG
jgi:hypothetical protein